MAGMLIKCSTCGLDIDIERLSDHLCGPGLGSTVAKQAPRSFNDAFSNMSVNQSAPVPFRSKIAPRSIDSKAANVPFLGIRPAPAAAAPPAVPLTRKSPFTSRPAAFPRPESNLVLPQECAFPPFPLTSKSSGKTLQRANTDPPNSARSETFTPEINTDANYKSTTVDPRRPSTASSNQQPTFSTPQQPSIPVFDQQPTIPSLPNLPAPKSVNPYPRNIPTPEIPQSPARPLHTRNKSSVAAANRPLDEIGGTRPYKLSSSRIGAAPTFDQPRSASAQGHRYDRSIHDNAPPVPSVLGNEIPRSASAGGIRATNPYSSRYDTPPMPSSLQHERSDSQTTTGHTPSESTSSNQSDLSAPTTSSSRSSPPSSPPRKGRYIQENLHNSSARGLGIESERPVARTRTKSFSRPSYAQPTIPILSPETLNTMSAGPWSGIPEKSKPQFGGVLSPDTVAQFSAGPWQPSAVNKPTATSSFSPNTIDQISAGPWAEKTKKTSEPPTALNLQTTNHGRKPSHSDPFASTPESPMDPALKGNKLPLLKVQDLQPETPYSEKYTRSAMTPSTRSNDLFKESRYAKPLGSAPLHRAQTVSKGRCRGCNEIITGKSVSSADGRLTGRWHKRCFTCRTCAEPFPSMDFYVLGNDPYCARHYHRLNKSLCASCDRGIEGQYVDDQGQKYHPHCFTCSQCHLILRDTYFDLNGKIYCETHAFRLDQLPPFGASGRRYPEKRSTRLLMI